MAQRGGIGRTWAGMDGAGPGNGWRGRVTLLSGAREREGQVWARVCGWGVRWGVRRTLAKQYGERKAMVIVSQMGAGVGCSQKRQFGHTQ